MFAPSEPTTSPLSTSSASEAPAKTSALRASELASLVLRAAFSTSVPESLASFAHRGSSSKTLLRVLLDGSTLSGANWESSAMQRYRSRLQQAISARRIDDPESSLLPTLTVSSYGSNRGGEAGREGHVRRSLPSMARLGLLPTLCSRDDRGPAPTQTKGGRNLPKEAGGHLSPTFCEWFMAFPVGWTEPVIGSPRSATRARRHKPKSPAT